MPNGSNPARVSNIRLGNNGAPSFSPYRPIAHSPTRDCTYPSARLSCKTPVQPPTSPEGIAQVSILKYTAKVTSGLMARDDLTIEEPLEISVKFRRGSNLVKN